MRLKTVRCFLVGLLLSFGLERQLPAQVYTVLHNFTNSPDGNNPSGFVMVSNTIYGVTGNGGSDGLGVVYAVNTDGTGYSPIFNFDTANGAAPNDLIFSGNTLYGTTYLGGSNNVGVVFKLDPATTNYTILHTFSSDPSDGEYPKSGLVLGGETLFGTTTAGGTNGQGTVFAINTNGLNFTNLYSFSNAPDGQLPFGGLVLGGGTLFGTTEYGGSIGYGVIFKIATNGADYGVLRSFTNYPDAQNPAASLVLGGTVLYGTTSSGGSNSYGGTIFAIDTNGNGYSILHSFTYPNAATDGDVPKSTLVLNGQTLFGVTTGGGSRGFGTIFQLDVTGSGFQLLKNITNGLDGQTPLGNPVLSGGTLFTTTYYGGSQNGGTLSSLQLSPFILAPPQSVTVTNGDPANFSVAATGPGSLGYQWYFQTNTPLADATNTTLHFDHVDASLAGIYTAVVTNVYGSSTSSPASLTVLSLPNIFGYAFDPLSGSFSLSMADVHNSTNRLWASTNLANPAAWQVIATNVIDASGLWLFTNTQAASNNPIRFYRLSTP